MNIMKEIIASTNTQRRREAHAHTRAHTHPSNEADNVKCIYFVASSSKQMVIPLCNICFNWDAESKRNLNVPV